MILAIVERIENKEGEKFFSTRYYLTQHFKNIFDKLNILLFPVISEKNLEQVCNLCDGLIVTGNKNHIHPKYYNEIPISEEKYKIDEFKLDKKIIHLFHEQNKPILGICGGLQSLNVAFGGSLNQDIPNHYIPNKTHKVKIKNNTFLEEVYHTNHISVNSYHHQSIKEIAPNFTVSAISEDGIIEAMEDNNMIGVQWHPEKVNDLHFFETFIEKYFEK